MADNNIRAATSFLNQPNCSSLPWADRIRFLQQQGLSHDEILEAVSRHSSSQPVHQPTTAPPAGSSWGWGTLVAMSATALVGAGLGYFVRQEVELSEAEEAQLEATQNMLPSDGVDPEETWYEQEMSALHNTVTELRDEVSELKDSLVQQRAGTHVESGLAAGL